MLKMFVIVSEPRTKIFVLILLLVCTMFYCNFISIKVVNKLVVTK